MAAEVEPVEPVLRDAEPDDVAAICRFGEAHIRAHYAPLIGVAAADAQVVRWWNGTRIGAAVAEGLVVVAEAGGQLVGVGQRGRRGTDHVVYKLYVHRYHRGRRLGSRLLDALTRRLPPDADRLYVEHSRPMRGRAPSMSARASRWNGSRTTARSAWCGGYAG